MGRRIASWASVVSGTDRGRFVLVWENVTRLAPRSTAHAEAAAITQGFKGQAVLLDVFVDEAIGLVIATVDHGAHEAGGAPAGPEAALDNNTDPRL